MKRILVSVYRDTIGQVPDARTDMDIAATAFFAQNDNWATVSGLHHEIAYAVPSRY